jgi:hypothetical protein
VSDENRIVLGASEFVKEVIESHNKLAQEVQRLGKIVAMVHREVTTLGRAVNGHQKVIEALTAAPAQPPPTNKVVN